MAIVIKIWVDGDPDVDSPLINISADSTPVKDAAKRAAVGAESCPILCTVCHEAEKALRNQEKDYIQAESKATLVAALDTQKTAINALAAASVSAAKITSLQA
jgi:hypothetical protein